MKIKETILPGVLLVEPAVFADNRGCFLEIYNRARYAEAGIPTTFVQDNFSRSVKGTLRGLHFQEPFGNSLSQYKNHLGCSHF